MSKYYTAQRTRGLYNPKSKEQFKLSRSKIDLYLACKRCFYYDRRLGIGRPPGFPFALNSAVDTLIEKYGIDAKPVSHKDLDKWRHNFTGVQYYHKPTNMLIFGAIDDLWQNSKGEYIVVDYKATAKAEEINSLDKDWHIGYKRQMEIYQWLLRQNKYKVSNTGYFVYCNGKADKEAFDSKLEFDITLISYKGNDNWVEKIIIEAHKCLNSDDIPKSGNDCDYCSYIDAIRSK